MARLDRWKEEEFVDVFVRVGSEISTENEAIADRIRAAQKRFYAQYEGRLQGRDTPCGLVRASRELIYKVLNGSILAN